MAIVLISVAAALNKPNVDNKIWDLFSSEQVKSFDINIHSNLKIITHSNKQFSYNIRNSGILSDDLMNLIQQQYDAGIIEKYTIASSIDMPWWVSPIPYLAATGIAAITVVLITIIKKYKIDKPGGNI